MTSKMARRPGGQVAASIFASEVHGRDAGPAIDKRPAELTEKRAKPVASKSTNSRKPNTRRRKPDQSEISKRASSTSKRASAMSSETGCARSAS